MKMDFQKIKRQVLRHCLDTYDLPDIWFYYQLNVHACRKLAYAQEQIPFQKFIIITEFSSSFS